MTTPPPDELVQTTVAKGAERGRRRRDGNASIVQVVVLSPCAVDSHGDVVTGGATVLTALAARRLSLPVTIARVSSVCCLSCVSCVLDAARTHPAWLDACRRLHTCTCTCCCCTCVLAIPTPVAHNLCRRLCLCPRVHRCVVCVCVFSRLRAVTNRIPATSSSHTICSAQAASRALTSPC